MSKPIYPKGIYFNPPHPKAPSFVLVSISIDLESFDLSSLKQYANGKYVRLNIKEGKEKPYMEIDTYKPQEKKELDISDCPFK
jgi:hypothetical protein